MRYSRDRIIIRKTAFFGDDEVRYRVIFKIKGKQRIYDSVSKASIDRLRKYKALLGAEWDIW